MTSAPRLTHNIFANFAGRGWESLLSLLVIPFYIKLMGVEAYGLLGLYASMFALFMVLDMGLSATLNRQLSRLAAAEGSAQEAGDLVRTLEVVYWGAGFLIGLVVLCLAPFISGYWVNPQNLSEQTVEQAVLIMGLVVAFQWPAALYSGGITGLQRLVSLNLIRSVMIAVTHGGAILCLLFVSPTIQVFFVWLLFASVLNTLALGILLHKSLPRAPRRLRFSKALLLKNGKFAAGMTGISLVVVVLTQLDKIVLTKMVSLEMFGYYTLAFNVANTLNHLVVPIATALFPRLSQIIVTGEASVSELYHKSCQIVSIVVLPAALILVLFSKDILALWLNEPVVVEQTYLLLSILAVGSGLNSVMLLPYNLQLAYGWTKLSLVKNIIAVFLFVPLLVFLVQNYGVVGAAISWGVLNAGYFFIEIPFMHRRLLTGEMSRWYFQDVLLPLAAGGLILVASRVFSPGGDFWPFGFLWVVASYLLALSSAAVLCRMTGSFSFRKAIS